MRYSAVGRARGLLISACVCAVAMMVLPVAGSDALPKAVFIEGVPLYQQIDAKGCGAVSMQMVFDYHGEYVDQREIYNAARSGGTALPDMARAAQFSHLSTTMGSRWPDSIVTGYTARDLGYAGFYYASDEPWLDEMKQVLAAGYPVIVLVYWMPEYYASDHYRVVVGYDDSEGVLLINDGWSREFKMDQDYQGSTSVSASLNSVDPDFVPLKWKYEDFIDTWTCDTTTWNVPGLRYGAVLAAPWEVQICAPSVVAPGEKFSVCAKVTYPCLGPFLTGEFPKFPAASFSAAMEASGMKVCKEPDMSGMDVLEAGETVTLKWEVCACQSEGVYDIGVTATGMVSGSLDEWKDYPAYEYDDLIGGTGSVTVEVVA